MGGLKEYYLESQEKRYIKMAEALGITWKELLELDYEISAKVSRDGLIYGYIMQFSEENDPVILQKIIEIDERKSVFLDPWVMEEDSDNEYELEAISENLDPAANFYSEINNLEKLLAVDIDERHVKEVLLRQVFISMISLLETFLSDTFINRVTSLSYLERFVETHPDFQKQKISLSKIFHERRRIEEKARNVMVETIYHKLPNVKKMYEDTFSMKFPDISSMQKFISQRHDLVHRNGKTTDGNKVLVSEEIVLELKSEAVSLVKNIIEQLDRSEDPF